MSENPSPRSERLRFTAAATAAEIRGHISNVVAFARPEDNRKAAIAWAARVLELPVSRVKALYYGEARRIEAHEADRIRAYVQAASKLMQRRREYEEARRDFVEAAPRLAGLAPAAVGGVDVPPPAASVRRRKPAA